jgi:hypothetical protein
MKQIQLLLFSNSVTLAGDNDKAASPRLKCVEKGKIQFLIRIPAAVSRGDTMPLDITSSVLRNCMSASNICQLQMRLLR